MPADAITAGWPTLVELEDVIASMKQGTSDLAALAEERYLPLFDTYGKEPDPLTASRDPGSNGHVRCLG